MYDILTTAAIVDELNSAVTGGRVQRTGLRDATTVVLEIYANRARQSLVASIGGREPVCYLTRNPVNIDGSIVTPLSLLLRKFVRGGTLVVVDQPPLDRIIRLSIAKRVAPRAQTDELAEHDPDSPDDEEAGEYQGEHEPGPELVFSTLYIELMGRRSNIILVDNESVILESIKRVSTSMSRVRPILPHRPYSLPPAGDRLDPRQLSSLQVAGLLDGVETGQPVANRLVAAVSAVSPQIASEIVCRSTGSPTTKVGQLAAEHPEKIACAVRELFQLLEGSAWEPAVYEDEHGDAVAYAAAPHRFLDVQYTPRKLPSMSEAVEISASRQGSTGRHAGRRERLAELVDSARERARVKVATLEQQRQSLQDGVRYRRWGEAIFANLWTIETGQAELDTGDEVVPLDPELSPKDLAQEYFSQYRKSGRGLAQIDSLIQQASNQLAYLEQLATLVELADSFDELETLRREWEQSADPPVDHGQSPQKRKPIRKAARPKPVIDQFGNAVYIGRSGLANEVITFAVAGPDDYWLHARGVPGAHVILRPAQNAAQSLETALLEAASLAAWYSAARNDTAVSVDICKRRDVRKLKGAGPGMVTYRNERTINVRPRTPG